MSACNPVEQYWRLYVDTAAPAAPLWLHSPAIEEKNPRCAKSEQKGQWYASQINTQTGLLEGLTGLGCLLIQ